MGIRNTETEKRVALYDSVSDTAFGPIFDSAIDADEFVEFCNERDIDLRTASDQFMQELYSDWQDEKAEQESER